MRDARQEPEELGAEPSPLGRGRQTLEVGQAAGGGPPGGPSTLSWSPDGRWLAVPDVDGVHLIDTLGGTEPVVVQVGPGAQTGYVLLFAPTP